MITAHLTGVRNGMPSALAVAESLAARYPNDARALCRMSRSAINDAARLAAAPTPRLSPSTTSRASRGRPAPSWAPS